MWPYDHPLIQVTSLHQDTLHHLKQYADEVEIAVLRGMDAKELGEMIHMNERHGLAVKEAAESLPMVDLTYSLRPLTHDLLEVKVRVEPVFKWTARSSPEPFYIWIQDDTDINILQWRSILVRTSPVEIDFVLPLADTLPAFIKLLSASDRWMGSEEEKVISLEGLVMPSPPGESTRVLDVPYLDISCLRDKKLEQGYGKYIKTLNSIQTQCFWSCYHSQENVLVSAPVASGKSWLGEMAIW
jgi:antiviral helicase SLH1